MRISLYDILEIPESASPEQIRHAYRRLAMQFHPDRNASPEAHARFVAINKAHETLSDPFKRKIYDLRRKVGQVVIPRPTRPQPGGMDWWQTPAGKQRRKEIERADRIMARFARVMSYVAVISLLFSATLLVDRYFPYPYHEQVVRTFEFPGLRMQRNEEFQVQTQDLEFEVEYRYFRCVKRNDVLTVYMGRIWPVVTQITPPSGCTGLNIRLLDPAGGPFSQRFVMGWATIFLAIVVLILSRQKHHFSTAALGFFHALWFLVLLALLISKFL